MGLMNVMDVDDGGEWKVGRIGLNKSNLYERATALETASTLPRGGYYPLQSLE